METTEPINFKQRRDFGEKINATFSFVKENFQVLTKSIIYITGPVVCLMMVVALYLVYTVKGMLPAFPGSRPVTPGISDALNMLASMSIMGFLGLLVFILLSSVVYSNVKLYIDKGAGTYAIPDVWEEAKKHLLRVLGCGIGSGFAIGLGFIALIIPGIYIAIALSLINIVAIYENKGFFSGMSRSFELISGKWWSTFGLLLIMGMIQGGISYIFLIPMYVMMFTMGINDPTALSSPTFIIVIGVCYTFYMLASFLLSSLSMIALSFQYFNLVERKESKGLLEKIDKMGTAPTGANDEQF